MFQDTLRAWQEKNHPWLELSDVHKETTENIRVTVIPFYMGYRQGQGENQQSEREPTEQAGSTLIRTWQDSGLCGLYLRNKSTTGTLC